MTKRKPIVHYSVTHTDEAGTPVSEAWLHERRLAFWVGLRRDALQRQQIAVDAAEDEIPREREDRTA